MSHTLTLQLEDATYARIREEAAATGVDPEQLVVLLVEKGLSLRSPQNNYNSSSQGVEAHFGEISLGYATGADNESIDADLALEYSGNLPEG